jgi:hypothetical protein
MNRLEDLKFWRQFFRDQKAEHLKSYRRYRRICGENDSITMFMKGFSSGHTSVISVFDSLIAKEEAKDYGNS